MGLDACVYCNCYESGKLHTLPPRSELVYVDQDGALACRDEGDDDLYFEFTRWLHNQACEHIDGIVVHCRIGNTALVGLLRKELESNQGIFPLVVGKVLYSGTHGGDYIKVSDVVEMQGEIKQLSKIHSNNSKTEAILRGFEEQMSELVECSLKMNKPISF